MRNWILFGIFASCAAPVWAQEADETFLKGVAELEAAECHALADRIPDLRDEAVSDEALRLLSAAVREQCFLTAMIAATEPDQAEGGVTRGRQEPELDADMQARAKASANLLRSAMAADSGVQNDLLRRLLGQDPVPKG